MDMVYVDSSTVDQIGYDEYEREVHVIFKSGRHYAYGDVTSDVWEQFRDSPSKGVFLNQEFIAKGYPYREL
jgi:KTSC domain